MSALTSNKYFEEEDEGVAPANDSDIFSLSFSQYNAAILGGAKGAGLGLSVALPTAYILHQRWLPFRHLTLPLKAFFVTSGTIVAGIISADKAGIAFEVSGGRHAFRFAGTGTNMLSSYLLFNTEARTLFRSRSQKYS